MKPSRYYESHLHEIFYVVLGFLIFSASSLTAAALVLFAVFPIYCLAACIVKPLPGYTLGYYFFAVGIFLQGLILLLMDYTAFKFPNPLQFFVKVLTGDSLSLFMLLLLFFACFSGYFFANSMKSRIIALILFTALTDLFIYFLLDLKNYSGDKKFVACFLVTSIIPIIILKFFPLFLERLFQGISNLSEKDQKHIAHSLANNLKSFWAAFNQSNLLIKLGEFVWRCFGLQKREFLGDILNKAVQPVSWRTDIKTELLQHFRETIGQLKDQAEMTMYYEFIDGLRDLTVPERIRLCDIYFQDAVAFKNELTYHGHALIGELKKVIGGANSYAAGLSVILYRFWRNKNMFPALSGDLMTHKRNIFAFATIETVELLEDEYKLLTDLPPFHPAMSQQAGQGVVVKVLNESDIDINGSNVNIWLIKDTEVPLDSNVPDEILQALVPTTTFILCGHSISPVCRRVTSSVNQAKQELKGHEDRFTAGIALLHNLDKHRKGYIENTLKRYFFLDREGQNLAAETPFETLERSLVELKNRTGLLEIESIPQKEYQRKLDQIHRSISQFTQSSQEEILICDKQDSREIPAIVPIYCLQDNELLEVSFIIPKALITSKTYHTILSLFAQMSFIEMATDIKRKMNVISQWKRERISEIEQIKRNLEQGNYLPIPGKHRANPTFFIDKLDDKKRKKYGYYAKYAISDDHFRAERVKELIHQFVDWLERIAQLESGIKADENFIEFYKKQLTKIDQFRKDAGESSFEDELIDIMLRKWDLGFKFERLKKLFDQWVDEVRASVWTFAEEQLKSRNINLSFISVPNLWFEVGNDTAQQWYHIKPRVVVNANDFKLIRKDNLILYGHSDNANTHKKVNINDDMSLEDIAGQLKTLLSSDYKGVFDLFIKKAKTLLQFNPQYMFDIRGMLSGIESKMVFGKIVSLWQRALEENDYESAIEALDQLEESVGNKKLPEIYYWRALTYAKCDDDQVNYKNSLMPGYGYRTENYTKLPYELLFEYIIGTNRIKENEELRKGIEGLVGKTKLTHREAVKQHVSQVKKIDNDYYENLLTGRYEHSAARKELESQDMISADEKRFYHFYQAVELYKTLLQINAAFSRAGQLIELSCSDLKKSYDDIRNEISNIAIPYFVEGDMLKLLAMLNRRENPDEMYMKIFFASEIEVILDQLFIQCIENAKIAYRNNPGDKIIYDFLYHIYMISVNFKEALWVLFPEGFPIIFSSAMAFSPESKHLSYQEGDDLDITYDNGYYVFTLTRAQEKIQLGKYKDEGEQKIMARLRANLSNLELLPSVTYESLLSKFQIEAPEIGKKKLFTFLEENFNDLIRAIVYGEFKLIDESALKFFEIGKE